MDKKWPFGFFVYSSVEDKKEEAQPVTEVAEPTPEPAPAEVVKVVWAEPPASVIAEDELQIADEAEIEIEAEVEAVEEDDAEIEELEVPEETIEDDDEDEDEDEDDDADLEEELEIALEKNHQQEVKKQRLITGISAGVALLGAVGLATGLAIHAHFKKNK